MSTGVGASSTASRSRTRAAEERVFQSAGSVSPRSTRLARSVLCPALHTTRPGTVRVGREVRQPHDPADSAGRPVTAHPPRAAGLPEVSRPVHSYSRSRARTARARGPGRRSYEPMRGAVADRRLERIIRGIEGRRRPRHAAERRPARRARPEVNGQAARTRLQVADCRYRECTDHGAVGVQDGDEPEPHASPDLEPSLEGGDRGPRPAAGA